MNLVWSTQLQNVVELQLRNKIQINIPQKITFFWVEKQGSFSCKELTGLAATLETT